MQSVAWDHGVFAALDTETSGLDRTADRILSLALILVDAEGRVLPGGIYQLVNAGIEVPDELLAIHGLTQERLEREGILPEQLFPHVLELLDAAAQWRVPLVVFNAPFDLSFLAAECRRLRLGHSQAILSSLQVLDPLLLDRTWDKFRPGPRRLMAVAQRYGVDTIWKAAFMAEAHSALSDAYTAERVSRQLLKQYGDAGMDAMSLHTQQIQYYADWKTGFNQYLKRQGKSEISAEEVWPGI